MVHPDVIIAIIFQMTGSERASSCPKVTQPVDVEGSLVKPGPYNSKASGILPSVVRKTKTRKSHCKDMLQTQLEQGGQYGWLQSSNCLSI